MVLVKGPTVPERCEDCKLQQHATELGNMGTPLLFTSVKHAPEHDAADDNNFNSSKGEKYNWSTYIDRHRPQSDDIAISSP